MAIIATASGDSGNFEPAPQGPHRAICVDVIDKGVLEVTYAGKTKKQHKISLAWQIDELRDDGKPYLVFKRYTLSLNEKATLRKDLESWRGKAFTREEEMGFDVEKLIGANCILNIQHAQRGDQTYANVMSVMPLMKGMEKIVVSGYTRVSERPKDAPEAGDQRPDDDEPPMPTDDDLSAVPF